jgi:transcriptional regulator with XRE-family HTH domain
MAITKKIAKQVRFLREEKRLKQDVLANELKMRQSSYSKLESGKTNITLDQLEIISKVLCVNIADFFSDSNDKMSFKFTNNTNASGLTINQNQISDNERKLYEQLIESLQRQSDSFKELYEECKKNK